MQQIYFNKTTKLFSPKQIFWTSLCSNALLGVILLMLNHVRLNQRQPIARIVFLGFPLAGIQFYWLYHFYHHPIKQLITATICASLLQLLAQRLQGQDFANHLENQGLTIEHWLIVPYVFICLLCSLITIDVLHLL